MQAIEQDMGSLVGGMWLTGEGRLLSSIGKTGMGLYHLGNTSDMQIPKDHP